MADEVLRGKVVHFKFNDDESGYHGFIRQHGCGDMSDNVRFTDVAVEGVSPALGDDVKFTLLPRQGERRNCKKIWRA